MITATPWCATLADAASTTPRAPMQRLNNALLAAMKWGGSTGFDKRYRALEPVIDRVFDLGAVQEASIELSWVPMLNAQKIESATRYTVSSCVSNFDSYDGQKFEVLPTVRRVGNGGVIAQTQLVRTDRSPVKLDYVMRQGRTGRHVVDVLTDSSISRVAVARSNFPALLARGGEPALAAGLKGEAVILSGRAA